MATSKTSAGRWGGEDIGRDLWIPVAVVLPLAALLVFGGPHYMVGFAILAMFGMLFLANTRAFILLFLVLIAMRDWIAGGERIDIGILTFDLGGLVNIITTLIGVVYFLVLWRNPFKGRSLTWPYLVFWGLFAISLPWAPDFRQGIRFVTRLLAPFVTYLIVSDLLDRVMVRAVIRALYLSSVIPIVYGFWELLTGTGNTITAGLVRVQSCFHHPAHFSMYLLFMFCLAYATFLDKRTVNRPAWLAYIGAILVLLLCTYTRISWIATAVCFVYLSWAFGKTRYLVVVGLIGAVVVPLYARPLLERMLEIDYVLGSHDLLDRSNSIGWRLYFWTNLIDEWKLKPWFGYGTGSSIVFGRELMGVWTSPHNGYLRVLYETGIVGAAAFAWVLLTMLRQAVRLLRSELDDSVKLVSHVYVTMTISYIILNLTDNILEYYEVAIYNWAILSLVEYSNRVAAAKGLIEAQDFEEAVEVPEDEEMPLFVEVWDEEREPERL
jgi:O-antigen ligase